MDKHLVFYDQDCALCHRAVRHILEIDEKKEFLFAPFKGETAQHVLSGPNAYYTDLNSLVLLENYQSTERNFWIRSKAIFRIYWLLGGKRKFLGALSFLPCCISDRVYSWVANHRHQFKFRAREPIGPADRFLS